MSTTKERPLALVTGASSGIGLELARQFAEHGYDLILAAEDGELESAATQLKSAGAQLELVTVDLTKPEGVDELYSHVERAGRPLEAAAINAGIGDGGAFATETPLEKELEVVDLNVRSVVHLAKYVTRDMVARGHGRILFTSSIASTMPGPFHTVYNASKSFVQSFALALRSELQDTDVTVTSLMPGPTDTNFFAHAGVEDTILGSMPRDDPADVARQGFEALMAGRERVIASSASSRLQGRSGRLLPDSAKAAMHRVLARPGSASRLPSALSLPGGEDRQNSLQATTLRIVRRLLRGSTVASRSLPIRATREEVQRAWSSDRERILDGLPVTRAELSKGVDQGEWGTSWTLEVEFEQSLPRRLAQPLAGKAVRRLKSQAETGEMPTTAHSPAFRGPVDRRRADEGALLDGQQRPPGP